MHWTYLQEKIIGAIHTHPNNVLQMFSWSDLFTLFRLHNDARLENKNDVVFMLQCQSGTYALKVDDFLRLRAYIYTTLNNEAIGIDLKQRKKDMDIKFDLDTRRNAGEGVSQDLEYGFLKTLSARNIPISFYKLNVSNNKFEKLYLKPTSVKNNVEKGKMECL